MASKKIPACPRTITGQHCWAKSVISINNPDTKEIVKTLNIILCLYCNLVDDRKETDAAVTKD